MGMGSVKSPKCTEARTHANASPFRAGCQQNALLLLWLVQMVDEDPYELPTIDERHWFTGGHLGSQIQRCNWQVRAGWGGWLGGVGGKRLQVAGAPHGVRVCLLCARVHEHAPALHEHGEWGGAAKGALS